MTKAEFDILLSFILMGVFLIGGLYLYRITKRDWKEASLKIRNYMFVFCSILNFGLVIFLGILVYTRLT